MFLRFFFLIIRRPPTSPLFPSTTLFRSLAGFMLARAGHLLQPGETVEHDGARFTVERVDRRRIRRVRFTPAQNPAATTEDRKSTRLNSSHANISYAVFCLKKKQISTWHA